MKTSYSGRCRNGPRAGEYVKHWARVMPVYKPDDNGVKIGEYELIDGIWWWRKT